jgi:quercetin dioxygenase-like cupin family protein
MEVKFNESTHNRPWGERPVDAPVVPVDLHGYIQQLMQEEAWQKNDRNAITVFKTDKITIVLGAMHKDAEMKPGNVDGTGVMSLQILDGALKFSTENERIELQRGQMIMVHEHIPYTAVAIEETMYLLTMTK